MDRDDARTARNQAIFRAANEAIRANAGRNVDGIVLICECGDAGCFERIGVRGAEYEAVRRNERAFLVVPGHEERSDAGAIVVDENERFVVLEQLGEGGRIAESFDAPGGAPPGPS